MSDFIATVLAPNANLFSTIISAVLAAVIYVAFKPQIDFKVMDWWYTTPWIGKIARLAKDSTQATASQWMNAERTLCADYKKYIHLVREPVFKSSTDYLKKAHDHGKAPMPTWTLLFLICLVIAEGLGFSYLLGTWMAREGSADIHLVMMIAIVLVLCGILVWVTHAAGQQFYRTCLLRGCFKQFKEEGGKTFFQKTIALIDDQSQDDHAPDYTQCANRVSDRPGDLGGYGMVALAAFLIAGVAILSTTMRWNNLQGELIRETAIQTQSAATGNPFANGGLKLPDAVTAPQKDADAKIDDEARAATKSEGLAAFAMLAIIFVVTQIVGCATGYKHAFAGRLSKDAYKAIRGFATYDAYMAHYEPLMSLAESRLQALQQKLEEAAHQKLKLQKTFMDYLNESADAGNSLRQTMNRSASTAPQAPATVAQLDPVMTVELALQRLSAINDKEGKIAFMKTLEPSMRQQVATEIKAEKERLAAKADAELNDLF